MTSSYKTRNYLDIADYTTSSCKASLSVTATSSGSQNYYYFTCYQSGTFTVYTAYQTGDFYVTVYNATKGTTIISRTNLYSGNSSKSAQFTADAGDVIYVSLYNYYPDAASSTCSLYVSGAGYPTSTATLDSDYLYDSSSTDTVSVTYGEAYTLPTITRPGYTFLGWYNGNTKVEDGVWNRESNLTLVPRWQVNISTITLDPNGGTVSTGSLNVIYDSTYALPTPHRTGYTFLGWFADDVQYTSGIWQGTSDVTLVAAWVANTYALTFGNAKVTGVSVTLNYNYTGATDEVIELGCGETLSYPPIPRRSGYAFAGWYTDAACTTQYSFSGTITSDITLYAKWTAMTSSYKTRNYLDIAGYTNASCKASLSVTATSSGSQNYYYFTCYQSGTFTIYTAWQTGDFYVTVYNATKGTTIISETNLWRSNSSKSASFTADAGDVIYVSLYNYSSTTSSTCSLYVSGAGYPTSTAAAPDSDYLYDSGSTDTVTVTYGEEYTLPTITRAGYTFLGWYNGNTKVESGTWQIASDVTLVARWQ